MKNLPLLLIFLFPIILSGQGINEQHTIRLKQEMNARADALNEILKTQRKPKKGIPFYNNDNAQSRNRASSCNLAPVPAYACQEVYNFNSDLVDSMGVLRIENTYTGGVLEKQVDYAIDEVSNAWMPTFKREHVFNDTVNLQVLYAAEEDKWNPTTLVERHCGGKENVFLNILSNWNESEESWALNSILGIEVLYQLDTFWYLQDWRTPSIEFDNQNVDFEFDWIASTEEAIEFDINFEFENNTEDSLSRIVFVINHWDTLKNEWAPIQAKSYVLTKEEMIVAEELLFYDGEEFIPFKSKNFFYDENNNLSEEFSVQLGLTEVESSLTNYFYNEERLLDSIITDDVALGTLERTNSKKKIFTYDEQSRLHSETLYLWQSDEEGWRISTRNIFEQEDNVVDVIKKYFRFPTELEAFKLQEIVYSNYDIASCTPFLVSTQDLQLQQEFDVYPNPSWGLFGIYNENFSRAYDYRVLNAQGQVLEFKTNVQGDQTFDISTLPKGIYFLLITADNATFSKKLILN